MRGSAQNRRGLAGRATRHWARRVFRPTDLWANRPLHVLDNIIPEFGALDLRSPGRQSRKIVRNPLAGDGAV